MKLEALMDGIWYFGNLVIQTQAVTLLKAIQAFPELVAMMLGQGSCGVVTLWGEKAAG